MLFATSKTNASKRNQLAKRLGVKRNQVEYDTYDDNTFIVDGAEYLVYTDREATEACNDRIKDSLWAFNADFLASYTRIDSAVFTALSDMYESANDAVLSIIEGTKGKRGFIEFAKRAVNADGRGHFLSSYDGDEIECGRFYAYRVN